MNIATGQTYPNIEAAIEAGENPKNLVRIKTIPNGPFKGRTYIQNEDGSLGKRVDLIMKAERERAELIKSKELVGVD